MKKIILLFLLYIVSFDKVFGMPIPLLTIGYELAVLIFPSIILFFLQYFFIFRDI